ncbi:MAG: aminoacetone oxidase family FAD-binding enzyme [Alkaliphilus sp.]|nr:NAD(P)/FAD-dependent oxidoreductase [bacterium AH-315-L21]PHS33836.1 MAG: aminoacetone oxidase family FAD-binding enzyme [Alkaliphilus sp.]
MLLEREKKTYRSSNKTHLNALSFTQRGNRGRAEESVCDGSEYDVAVIGGGASGLVAAICAARKGAKVVLIERLNRVGKKILATGNGRCNFSNVNLDINHFHGKNAKFAESALEQLDLEKTLDFFEKLGIAYKIEDLGKFFPKSEQATSILDVLRYELERLKVEERCNVEVTSITHDEGTFRLACFAAPQKNMTDQSLLPSLTIKADKIIIATGGKASPNLGSNGSGYNFAKSLGHKIVKPFPVIVQLNLKERFVKQIKGVKFKGKASIGVGREILREDKGEILFTDYGISGPPILQLSRKAGEQLQNSKHPWLDLDLFPDLTIDKMKELIKKRITLQEEKPLDCNFIGLINKRLIPIILKEAKIKDINMPSRKLNDIQINNIARKLKEWRFEVIGTQPWKSAQVTAGGIDVKDINPNTMESKLIKGLFFAGEIIDIDGDCGGFNLQWAWSSGFVAGTNVFYKSL